MKKITWVFLFAMAAMPASLYANMDTVKVASDSPSIGGNLNTAVQTAINAGTLSSTVFELDTAGYYVLTSTIIVPPGQELTIVGPDPTLQTRPPQIVWTVNGSPDETYNFNCYGDITLKNIWLMYADENGNQVGSELIMQQDTVRGSNAEEYATFNNVIFDYVSNGSGGAVTVNCMHLNAKFINCYFKNCINTHLRYYARALSYDWQSTGYGVDSVLFQNTTFANMGYVLMQEGGEYANYVKFNHCTFLDIVEFPLESSWWHDLSVTNCIFENVWMFGNIPAQDSSGVNGALFAIDSVKNFGFSVPFSDQQRHILLANSSYFMEPWLLNWMKTSPYSVKQAQGRNNDLIPVPQPILNSRTWYFFDSLSAAGQKLYPYMNAFNLDTTNNPMFVQPPTDTGLTEGFLNRKWDDNSDTNWAWKPINDINLIWPLQESLAYTNTTMKTEGMGGFPLGDLFHWWPNQYKAWSAQEQAENDSITSLLMNGRITAVKGQSSLPTDYRLAQNYPNPFNPTTRIEYSVPKSGLVTLDVYNVLGEKVATLFSGVRQPGSYTATFNGSSLASGVYFYRLKAGGVMITKKLVLLK